MKGQKRKEKLGFKMFAEIHKSCLYFLSKRAILKLDNWKWCATWQWWKSLRSWLLKCQRKFFLSPKVRWHLLHLNGRSLLWTTLMWRSKSPRRVKRASHKSHAWGRSWAWVFKWAFKEPGFIIRWQDKHSILAPSPSPTTIVRTWIRPSPSSSYSSKSSAFY